MPAARMTAARRRTEMAREIAFQKVTLALHWLAGEDGLSCHAWNTTLSRECGCSPRAVARCLAEMERRGLVEVYDHRDGMSTRLIILMDHPEARDFSRHLR